MQRIYTHFWHAVVTFCRFFFFFFEYFILRGIFFQNRGKKHTFWRGEWGRISAPKTAEKNAAVAYQQNLGKVGREIINFCYNV